MRLIIAILLVTNTIAAACYGFQGNLVKAAWHLFFGWDERKGVNEVKGGVRKCLKTSAF